MENIDKRFDFSKYKNVFCDSIEAIDWAYENCLPESAIIRSSSPAVLWNKKKNIQNLEEGWDVDKRTEFQSTIQEMTRDVFDIASGISGVERELALSISLSAYKFQKIIYKAACLNESDLKNPVLFIYVDGKNGPAGNMMNSPWDDLLSSNPQFSRVDYKLKNDNWNTLGVKKISYWKRLSVAGYESLIYRIALRLMKIIPDFVFSKELLMPNENELNIEIASSLALKRVKITKIKLNKSINYKNKSVNSNNEEIFRKVLPIILKRVEKYVTQSAVETTISLYKLFLEEQINQFKSFSTDWSNIITKCQRKKKAVLINSPGNISGFALSYACRKNKIPFMSCQHGVTVEISKSHSMLHVALDNSAADIVFSYNSKIVEIERNSYFNNAKFHIVGMPMRLIRMRNFHYVNRYSRPIVYISTNLYRMGFSISSNTDYNNAKCEQELIKKVLKKIPHNICYKTYPEDNRRYADIDPVYKEVTVSDNIELFLEKIDMRYLLSKYRVLVTTCATSTLGWPVMSGKPVVFINQKNKSPLTDDAYASFSQGLFLFDDQEEGFHDKLLAFLSQPINKIEKLWEKKKDARKDMIKNYFSEFEGNAGTRSSKIILEKYLR